jgi:hypothetical protein
MVEWSSYDNEEDSSVFLEDTETVSQNNMPQRAVHMKHPRRTIEILKEQQQLRELLQDFND